MDAAKTLTLSRWDGMLNFDPLALFKHFDSLKIGHLEAPREANTQRWLLLSKRGKNANHLLLTAADKSFVLILKLISLLILFSSVFEKDDTAVLSLLDVGFNRVSNVERNMTARWLYQFISIYSASSNLHTFPFVARSCGRFCIR